MLGRGHLREWKWGHDHRFVREWAARLQSSLKQMNRDRVSRSKEMQKAAGRSGFLSQPTSDKLHGVTQGKLFPLQMGKIK